VLGLHENIEEATKRQKYQHRVTNIKETVADFKN